MFKHNHEILLGAFILASGGLLAYMSIAVGGLNLTPGVVVSAKFDNASGLVKDAMVAVAGVQVGHVESLGVDHDKAQVRLFLNNSAQVRTDVIAAIRAKSLLGEKYVELRPQSATAPLLASGGTIARTEVPVEMDQLLTAVEPMLKKIDPAEVKQIVHSVAVLLDKHGGEMGDAMSQLSALSKDARDALHENRGHLDHALANLDALSGEGRSFLSSNRGELERAIRNFDRVGATLRDASPELTSRARRIAQRLDTLSADLARHGPAMARNADVALARLPSALEDLSKLRTGVDKTLSKANPVLDKTTVLLDKANKIDEHYVKGFTEDIMRKVGIRVYLY